MYRICVSYDSKPWIILGKVWILGRADPRGGSKTEVSNQKSGLKIEVGMGQLAVACVQYGHRGHASTVGWVGLGVKWS